MVRRLDAAAGRITSQVSAPDDVRGAERISPAAFASLWRQLDRDGRRLLAAALVLILVMNLPIWSLSPPLRSIAEIAEADGGIRFRTDFPPRGMEIPFDENRYR
jgi:hypothetical protein